MVSMHRTRIVVCNRCFSMKHMNGDFLMKKIPQKKEFFLRETPSLSMFHLHPLSFSRSRPSGPEERRKGGRGGVSGCHLCMQIFMDLH
ncbi:hypothetical protein CSUI_008704 [Cystoisospora suis]|uniref:Uncharacterized protein n=1 Tax=Cystoisospora suis TaxID=483139 RepID=A0A2C6KLZ9_9APIC|nr:hypothetical protein CSUI_008704 [Cystoisospora suis]